MNWLDFFLLLIMGASIVSGLFRGFARTIVGMVAAIAAVLAAIWFYGSASSFLADYVSHRVVANFLGFALVFALVLTGGSLFGWLLAKLFRWVGLGWLDRLLGAGVGLLRGALVATALVLLLCAFTRTPPPQSVVQSRVAPYLIEASNLISFAAPRELKDSFNKSYEKVKRVWRDMLKTVPGTA